MNQPTFCSDCGVSFRIEAIDVRGVLQMRFQVEAKHLPPTENDTDTPQTENSVASVESSDADPQVPYRSAELTVPEKIVEFLNYINEDHTATGTEIKKALGGLAPATFKWAMDQLVEDGKAEKGAYNLYRLRT